jgi:hypothetical protein
MPLEVLLVDQRPLRQPLRSAVGRLADNHPRGTGESIPLDDAQLIGEVELVAAQMIVDDRLCPLVALDTLAREHLNVDDGSGDT